MTYKLFIWESYNCTVQEFETEELAKERFETIKNRLTARHLVQLQFKQSTPKPTTTTITLWRYNV